MPASSLQNVLDLEECDPYACPSGSITQNRSVLAHIQQAAVEPGSSIHGHAWGELPHFHLHQDTYNSGLESSCGCLSLCLYGHLQCDLSSAWGSPDYSFWELHLFQPVSCRIVVTYCNPDQNDGIRPCSWESYVRCPRSLCVSFFCGRTLLPISGAELTFLLLKRQISRVIHLCCPRDSTPRDFCLVFRIPEPTPHSWLLNIPSGFNIKWYTTISQGVSQTTLLLRWLPLDITTSSFFSHGPLNRMTLMRVARQQSKMSTPRVHSRNPPL